LRLQAFRRAGRTAPGSGRAADPPRSRRPRLQLSVGGQPFPLEAVSDWSVAGSHEGTARIANAPLVFVGFGVHAPELGWDDYAGADLTGKIAVMLPNDPDFAQEQGPFGGRARSRYASGKARAAFDRGAVGVITIHRTALTSWPWQQRANSDPDPTWRRAAAPAPRGPTRLSAWMTDQSAARLFNRAGLDLEAQISAAQRQGFRAVPLPGVTVDAAVTVTGTPIVTRNFIARLNGTTRASETVVLGAHWDAYGVAQPDATGDTIRNGAVDNAVGTATMLEVARAFARAPRTQRSLLFIGYTAEEDGPARRLRICQPPVRPARDHRLGAEPRSPPGAAAHAQRRADRRRPHRLEGRSSPGSPPRRAAASRRRPTPARVVLSAPTIMPLQKPECPTVYFRAGRDLEVGGPPPAGRWSPPTTSNAITSAATSSTPPGTWPPRSRTDALVYNLMREVADSGRWPGWNANSDFAKVRDRSRASRR
jgi:hypothetical protein